MDQQISDDEGADTGSHPDDPNVTSLPPLLAGLRPSAAVRASARANPRGSTIADHRSTPTLEERRGDLLVGADAIRTSAGAGV